MMQMRANFRPGVDITMMPSWIATARKESSSHPEEETEPQVGEIDTLKRRKPTNSDSDNDTESATSSDKDTAAPTLRSAGAAPAVGVASSFARAGKLLWNSNPLAAALKKQHSRTVSDFSDSDFTPFPAGTPVWTKYGLGTVATTRADDGFLVVNIQGQSRMTLFLNPADEDYYSVPAIRHDWVETPAGEGRVVEFDAKSQMYSVRIGNDARGRVDVTVNVHRNDLRRHMPTRRQTHAPVAAPHATEPSVISKGLNSALKSIVTTSSGLSNSTYQFVANYYYHGQCVVTTFGSGTIIALDQTNHRAQVQLVWGAIAYISTDAILHYTKAVAGMEVTTKFGPGVVSEVRGADGMYAVKLTTTSSKNKDAEPEVVYVHESDLARSTIAGSRLRLGSAQKQVKEKLGSSTNRLFSFAQNKVKLFSQSSGVKNPSPPPATTAAVSPSPSATTTPAPLSAPSSTASASSRSKSARVIEPEDDVEEPSSAGI